MHAAVMMGLMGASLAGIVAGESGLADRLEKSAR
jgi:hypothetical protein